MICLLDVDPWWLKSSDMFSFVPVNLAEQYFILYIFAKVNCNYLPSFCESEFRHAYLHLHLLRVVTRDNSWYLCKDLKRLGWWGPPLPSLSLDLVVGSTNWWLWFVNVSGVSWCDNQMFACILDFFNLNSLDNVQMWMKITIVIVTWRSWCYIAAIFQKL